MHRVSVSTKYALQTKIRGTILTTYTDEINAGESKRCPQCRIGIWSDPKPNRDFMTLLQKLRMSCGGCSDKSLLTLVQARAHALECVSNQIRCPFFTEGEIHTTCAKATTVQELWHHCQNAHNNFQNKEIMILVGKDTGDGSEQSTFLSVDLTFPQSRNIFFVVDTSSKSFRFCLQVMCDKERVFCCLRRFFLEHEMQSFRGLVSFQAGEFCGSVIQLQDTVSSYETLQDIFDGTRETRMHKIIELPLPIFRQMSSQYASRAEISVTLCLQLWFSCDGQR